MAPIKPVLTSWANGSDYAKLDGSFCELTRGWWRSAREAGTDPNSLACPPLWHTENSAHSIVSSPRGEIMRNWGIVVTVFYALTVLGLVVCALFLAVGDVAGVREVYNHAQNKGNV